MDRTFPLGFPPATALYLTLYVCSLVAHVLFMSYVLAGSGYLAVVGIIAGGRTLDRQRGPAALALRDWLPFALGAAITAGVAPLLFVQVLYQRSFYTANLLLSPNWMALLAVLILGFYLLYLLKSTRIGRWPHIVRAVVGLGAFSCFLFTAFSWTRNHLLSLQCESWPDVYASGTFAYLEVGLAPRLATWITGSIPIMCVGVSWQLWATQRAGLDLLQAECRRISLLALCGLMLSAAGATLYYLTVADPVRAHMTGPLALPYLSAAAVGLLIQAVVWFGQWKTGEFAVKWLLLASAGMLASVVGTTVVREAIRLGSVDVEAFQRAHAQAAGAGGFYAFVVFLIVNAAVITLCLMLTKRGLRSTGGA